MAPERADERIESAPGDIGRGTQEETTAKPALPGESSSQDFATSQSFADPAHRRGSPSQAPDTVPSQDAPQGPQGQAAGQGGIRTQQTGSEEGARTPSRQAVTATSRESRGDVQEGEA